MKLLIGGSPCTHWSIAQTKNRETEASGIGWELFLNYRIARDKYQPDYFLYENNKSMSPAIREQITKELGVEPILINSALVSAQNRQRLYWVGKRNDDGTYSKVEVEQPEDRGILLKDVLDGAISQDLTRRNKAYALTATYDFACAWNTIERHQRNMVVEPVNITADGKSKTIKAQYCKNSVANFCGYSSTPVDEQKCYAAPCEWDENGYPTKAVSCSDGKAYPVYKVESGQITIKGKQYKIKLVDGYYIIRKLTVIECMRLQTVPGWYDFSCVSKSRALKMIGNGLTVDVIVFIMGHFGGIDTEDVHVLSMYDGMSCGRIALKKLGAHVVNYLATEIDEYAIKTTMHNFPDTVQLGDAFQVRDQNWWTNVCGGIR